MLIKNSSVKILIITTSHEQLGDTSRKTGVWLEELAVPYYIFKDAGAVITLASPLGGPIPIDPKSESIIASTSTIRRFQKDLEVASWMAHSIPLDTLRAADFDMAFLPGGHGAIWDFPGDAHLVQLLEDFDRLGKVIGLLSYAASILLSMKSKDGEPFVKGKDLTGYSNSEERLAGLSGIIPFSLESKLIENKAYYSKGADYVGHTVVNEHIVTGQNAASSAEVAKKMLLLLKEASWNKPVPQPY
jgi:putative intracellular protease/amidase